MPFSEAREISNAKVLPNKLLLNFHKHTCVQLLQLYTLKKEEALEIDLQTNYAKKVLRDA
ncbi:hypothetical protein PROFUN_04823 [Planoprotostelium fungivorum]|uniref:Uncharacterized protein n=1 Tax=Planoprotostelium fungivorum TaxID=1890364 RepID=A0A2P6NSZ8_9EUKA|nr:hypothetical protein PROFUN_04823 [Planoprotostelium fungivorum]